MNLARLLLLLATFSCASAFAAGKDVMLFLLAGQSNMDGCGTWKEMPENLQRLPDNVRIWDNRKQQWKRIGEDTTALARNLQFGPELAFSHRIAKAFPDREIRLVKTSAGGTSLANGWLPEKKKMYQRLIANYRNALADLEKSGHKVGTAGMLWMQGESDSEKPETANAYEANLKTMFSDVRKTTGTPKLHIVMGRISKNLLKSTRWNFEHTLVVQKAQDAVAAEDPDTSITHTDDLSTLEDNTHFDTKGQLTLGDEMAKLMLKALGKIQTDPLPDSP